MTEIISELYPCLKQKNRPPKWLIIGAAIILGLLIWLAQARGEEVNLAIIAAIESNNNPRAISYKGAKYGRGLYQISEKCLADYNNYHKGLKIKVIDLFNSKKAEKIAQWYFNKRIPALLRHFKLKDNLETRLICYNAGIGKYRKYKQGKTALPIESAKYCQKYRKLAKWTKGQKEAI